MSLASSRPIVPKRVARATSLAAAPTDVNAAPRGTTLIRLPDLATRPERVGRFARVRAFGEHVDAFMLRNRTHIREVCVRGVVAAIGFLIQHPRIIAGAAFALVLQVGALLWSVAPDAARQGNATADTSAVAVGLSQAPRPQAEGAPAWSANSEGTLVTQQPPSGPNVDCFLFPGAKANAPGKVEQRAEGARYALRPQRPALPPAPRPAVQLEGHIVPSHIGYQR